MEAAAAESGQWILAANDHAQNGIVPFQAATGRAFSPCRGRFSAQQDQAADHLGQIHRSSWTRVMTPSTDCMC
jgi:hypothetical protein